ncbi:MAG: cohesin domain-containing protein, partial [Saprospiraceae bacterium]
HVLPTMPLGPGPYYVAFDWSYSTGDGPDFDPFGFNLNAVPTDLTNPSGGQNQNGRALIMVSPGDLFEFAQRSTDGIFGPGIVTITNFVFIDGGMPIPVDGCPRKFCIGRVWSLEDDCGNAAANQLQIIKTQDVTPPDVAFPNTLTILADGGICTPLVDLDLSQEITDGCSAFADLIITNDALANYGNGNGTFSASGFYSPGLYTITFVVTDECGNTTTHIIDLEVIDAQDPFAVCNPAITVQLDNNGQAQITPPNVDNGSSDNCGIVNMTLSQDMFTVNDIGQVPVTLTVEDAQGNTNSCTSIVTVLGGVTFDAGDASGGTGDMVLVPVTVSMFTDITSFSFDLNITDGSVATVVGIQDVHPDLASGFLSLVNSATNVSVSWFDITVPIGQTIADGTTIFNLKVMLAGTPGSSTPVLIDNESVSQLVGGGPASALVPALGLGGTISVLNTGTTYTISGTLNREAMCGSDPIHLVTVDLTGSASGTIPSAPGAFSFTVPENSNATITPTKNINWVNGVTVNDALLVHQHAAGFTPLSSPYKIIAADANADNQVTVFDASLIHQLSIGFIPSIPGNTSWRFVPAVPALPGNPFPVGDEFLSYTNILANIPDADFIGMKIGDVNCTASPTTGFAGGVDERAEKLSFRIDDQSITTGQDVFVTLRAEDFTNVSAYQMTLTFDQNVLQFVEAIPGQLVNLTQADFNALRVGEGLLATNWYNLSPVDLPNGYELFTLKFKALQNAATLSDLLAATEDYIVIEAVTGDGDLMGVDLTFESPTAAGEQQQSVFALYQNRPNPFGHKTAIGFSLPESTSATLTILDPAGRVLKLIEGNFTAGYHQVIVDRDDLPAKGILFYRLETPKHQAIRKMVLMD